MLFLERKKRFKGESDATPTTKWASQRFFLQYIGYLDLVFLIYWDRFCWD